MMTTVQEHQKLDGNACGNIMFAGFNKYLMGISLSVWQVGHNGVVLICTQTSKQGMSPVKEYRVFICLRVKETYSSV